MAACQERCNLIFGINGHEWVFLVMGSLPLAVFIGEKKYSAEVYSHILYTPLLEVIYIILPKQTVYLDVGVSSIFSTNFCRDS